MYMKFCLIRKKDHLHNVNISEVIDFEKCSYLNVKKQMFQDTLRRWTCSRIPNTAQDWMAAFLS